MTTTTIVAFLQTIGLPVRYGSLTAPTFLPGILITGGGLLLDPAQLRFPGDILHEAGHLAVAPPARRTQMQGDAGGDAAEEMMAIAWSYAATVELKLDPAVVFHAAGYRGGSANLIENFSAGRYLGLPMLQWVGMAYDAVHAVRHGVAPFPHMVCWLRPDKNA